MDEEVGTRLVELETKAAFQEAAIQDMSGMIALQDARLERLEALVRALREKVKELGGEGQGSLPENERPPHY